MYWKGEIKDFSKGRGTQERQDYLKGKGGKNTICTMLQHLYEARRKMKEHEAVFVKTQNLIIYIVPESIWFVFYFKLNGFTIKISNLLLPFGAKRAEGHESKNILSM